MKFSKLFSLFAVLTASFAFADETPQPTPAKPSASRWQIILSVSGASYEGKLGNRAENTILLDAETGKTWLLWPTKDSPSGYSWIEIAQRTQAPKE